MTNSARTLILRDEWVATTAELHARGVSPDRLRGWVRRGLVTAVAHGVYAPAAWLARLENDPRRRYAVTVRALTARNPRLVASHESAAYLHGLDLLLPAAECEPPVTLTRPLTRRPQETSRAAVRGARVRVARLPDWQVTTALGAPASTAARAVVDIARGSGFMAGVVAADSALRTHAVIKVDLAIVIEDCARWRGTGRACDVMHFADGRAESALESVARVRFAEYRVPAPALQVNIRGDRGFIGRADFCWHQYRTIGEADGGLKYADQGRERARAQLARDEKLHDAGWATFHFTWRDIYYEPGPTVERLHRVFARSRRLAPA